MPITWNNVAQPNLSDATELLNNSASNLSSNLSGLANTINTERDAFEANEKKGVINNLESELANMSLNSTSRSDYRANADALARASGLSNEEMAPIIQGGDDFFNSVSKISASDELKLANELSAATRDNDLQAKELATERANWQSDNGMQALTENYNTENLKDSGTLRMEYMDNLAKQGFSQADIQEYNVYLEAAIKDNELSEDALRLFFSGRAGLPKDDFFEWNIDNDNKKLIEDKLVGLNSGVKKLNTLKGKEAKLFNSRANKIQSGLNASTKAIEDKRVATSERQLDRARKNLINFSNR